MSSKQKRSKFEEELAAVLEPAGALYEPYKVPYWMSYNYTPDFVLESPDEFQMDILVEAKGWFRPGDTKKYKAIAEDIEDKLVFLLQYPNKKVRKGAQLTMSGWCDKNDIPWFATPEELLAYANS